MVADANSVYSFMEESLISTIFSAIEDDYKESNTTYIS